MERGQRRVKRKPPAIFPAAVELSSFVGEVGRGVERVGEGRGPLFLSDFSN